MIPSGCATKYGVLVQPVRFGSVIDVIPFGVCHLWAAESPRPHDARTHTYIPTFVTRTNAPTQPILRMPVSGDAGARFPAFDKVVMVVVCDVDGPTMSCLFMRYVRLVLRMKTVWR